MIRAALTASEQFPIRTVASLTGVKAITLQQTPPDFIDDGAEVGFAGSGGDYKIVSDR